MQSNRNVSIIYGVIHLWLADWLIQTIEFQDEFRFLIDFCGRGCFCVYPCQAI